MLILASSTYIECLVAEHGKGECYQRVCNSREAQFGGVRWGLTEEKVTSIGVSGAGASGLSQFWRCALSPKWLVFDLTSS